MRRWLADVLTDWGLRCIGWACWLDEDFPLEASARMTGGVTSLTPDSVVPDVATFGGGVLGIDEDAWIAGHRAW